MMNLKQCLVEAVSPLMVFARAGETASAEITLRVYEAKAGYRLATNLHKPNSITGDNTPLRELAGVTETTTLEALSTDDSVAEMVSNEGETVFVDAALAFDLVGMELTHPVSGNTIVLEYASDDEMSEEDTSEEDVSEEEDESDIVDDVDEEASDEGDESEEDTSEEDMSDDEMSEGDESEEDVSEEEDLSEDDTVEISALDLVDATKNIRLVSISRDNNEFAVFCGANHIGTVQRTNAGEVASSLFSDASKLFSAFKPAVIAAINTGELASLDAFGFTPVHYSVKLTRLLDRHIERAASAARAKSTVDVAAAVDRNKRIVVLASLGLFKGALGTNVPLVKELAGLLSSAGVVDAEASVRSVLANGAEGFVRTIFDTANKLEANSDQYLTGLADTIKNAKFAIATPTGKAANLGPVTTMYSGDKPETAGVSGVISHNSTTVQTGNRFNRLFHGIGRR